MGFEKFQKHTGRGSADEPMISLRKTETIGVNGVAIEEHFGDKEGAVLYYNEADNQVGIKPADTDDPDAYTLQFSSQGRGASINAASFLKQYNLVPEQTTRYPAHWNQEQELIYIELTE